MHTCVKDTYKQVMRVAAGRRDPTPVMRNGQGHPPQIAPSAHESSGDQDIDLSKAVAERS